ncbi:hypothetical protein GCM10009799_06010 [Nocardiopsis rhodophaea]|uniref:Transposase n=1 Tax=Nocardiopsis rhodophaea TaxID=280238 RepID=A0ABN2SAS4_9ACTN
MRWPLSRGRLRPAQPWLTWDTGAGIGIVTPCKRPEGGRALAEETRTFNRLRSGLCRRGRAGFAPLTQCGRLLKHIRASPGGIGDIAKAALALTHFECGQLQ